MYFRVSRSTPPSWCSASAAGVRIAPSAVEQATASASVAPSVDNPQDISLMDISPSWDYSKAATSVAHSTVYLATLSLEVAANHRFLRTLRAGLHSSEGNVAGSDERPAGSPEVNAQPSKAQEDHEASEAGRSSAPCPKCGGSRWVGYLSETEDGTFEEAFRLCTSCSEDAGPGEPFPRKPQEVRGDLWLVPKVFNRGPEENLRLWRRAEAFLGSLCEMVATGDHVLAAENEALVVALADCRYRVREETQRAQIYLEMYRKEAAKQPEARSNV